MMYVESADNSYDFFIVDMVNKIPYYYTEHEILSEEGDAILNIFK